MPPPSPSGDVGRSGSPGRARGGDTKGSGDLNLLPMLKGFLHSTNTIFPHSLNIIASVATGFEKIFGSAGRYLSFPPGPAAPFAKAELLGEPTSHLALGGLIGSSFGSRKGGSWQDIDAHQLQPPVSEGGARISQQAHPVALQRSPLALVPQFCHICVLDLVL